MSEEGRLPPLVTSHGLSEAEASRVSDDPHIGGVSAA